MPLYVCRKDAYDLTDLVDDALSGEDNVVGIEVLVEGRAADSQPHSLSSIDTLVDRMNGELVRVLVVCPKDDVENVFVLRKP